MASTIRALSLRQASRPVRKNSSLPDIETRLRRNQVKDIQALEEQGTNQVFSATISGAKVIIKPAKLLYKRKMRDQIKVGRELQRERAAYLIGRLLGLRCPPLVLRELPDLGPASVQAFIDEDIEQSNRFHGSDEQQRSLSLRHSALLDAVVGNTDRHLGNVRIDARGLVHAIDHGLCFPDLQVDGSGPDGNYEALYENAGLPLTKGEIRRLCKLAEDRYLWSQLRRLTLSDKSLQLMIERLKLLLEYKHFPKQPELFVCEIGYHSSDQIMNG